MAPDTRPDPSSVFVEHRETVRRLLLRFVGEAEAEDLTQEVFVRVTKALPGFRGEASLATWIRRIARGVALDFLRSRRHRQAKRTLPLPAPGQDAGEPGQEVPLSAEPSEEAQAPRQLVQTEMGDCVREYVARLAHEHRVVIELKDLLGLSNPEIARRLGVSVDNAKIRLHRARKALRRELERGCDFYQSDTGSLACDRKQPTGENTKSVSPRQTISSKEVRPLARTHRASVSGRNKTTESSMNTPSSCGCAAPASPETCAAPATGFSPIAAEYVALGAAIGSNCEPCLRYHVAEALKLGLSHQDIASAIAFAAKVKDTPAKGILRLADQLTRQEGEQCSASSARAGKACGCS